MSAPTPPLLPPKPGSHETSGISTPSTVPPAPPPHPAGLEVYNPHEGDVAPLPPRPDIPDPGDNWLPQYLADKPIQDLAAILASPQLLASLTHSSSTIHPSLKASHDSLTASLTSNAELAARLQHLEHSLSQQRASTQAQLLSTHALERAWKAKQGAMDDALRPFSPAAMYQLLAASTNEQAQVCAAMEESFLAEGGEDESEVGEWVKKYREARVLFYQRQERKERWDEGRVGGWR